MWPWIAALGALGGYVLLTSKTASAATNPAAAPLTPGQIAQGLQANPSGLAPGFQGQVAPGTPAPTYPSQTPLPTFPDPAPYDPNAPTINTTLW